MKTLINTSSERATIKNLKVSRSSLIIVLNYPTPQATLFSNTFATAHDINNTLSFQNNCNLVNNFINNTILNLFPILTFDDYTFSCPTLSMASQHNLLCTQHQLQQIIRLRNSKKSFGYDGISSYIVKKCGFRFLQLLVIIFNNCFNNAYFPNCWKNAIVLPICKTNKNPSLPTSYRPISLLPCISKIYEKLVYNKLQIIAHRNELLPAEQFGFRQFHCTAHTLILFATDIINGQNRKMPSIATFIDIEKTFACVWINGIIYKLAVTFNVDLHLYKLLYSFLTNRTFQNIVRHTLNMNNYLITLHSYFSKWKIRINPLKSEAAIFKPYGRKRSPRVNRTFRELAINIAGTDLSFNDSVKYLGITFQDNMKFTKHIKT